ncbi:MAG: hypothetical protein AAFV33_15710 [Chloroflexota bacterium]
MTWLWVKGLRIRVQMNALGEPLQIRWDGRVHGVVWVANRWRVDLRWWRTRIWREYFKLATDTHYLLVVYRDLLTGKWYLQRLYD